MPAAYQGRLAIAAALKAAPHPPRTLDEEGDAITRLGFMSFDANKDGQLEFDEWIEQEFAAFLIYNASHDGKLKYDEFRRYYQNLNGGVVNDTLEREIKPRFAEMDIGGKGYLTIDDFYDVAHASFKVNDLNGDGRVTPEEIKQAAKGGSPHLLP